MFIRLTLALAILSLTACSANPDTVSNPAVQPTSAMVKLQYAVLRPGPVLGKHQFSGSLQVKNLGDDKRIHIVCLIKDESGKTRLFKIAATFLTPIIDNYEVWKFYTEEANPLARDPFPFVITYKIGELAFKDDNCGEMYPMNHIDEYGQYLREAKGRECE